MAYIFSDAVEFLDVCGDPVCASALVHSHKKRKPAGNDGLISANFALIFHFQCGLTTCVYMALLHLHRFWEVISSQCKDNSSAIAVTIDANMLKLMTKNSTVTLSLQSIKFLLRPGDVNFFKT